MDTIELQSELTIPQPPVTGKPIWLLDVDGVINCLNHYDRPPYIMKLCAANGRSWPISYRQAVVDFINRMATSGTVDVWWLTTWGHEAPVDLSEKLGIVELPVASDPYDTFAWWKWDVVKNFPEWHDRPLIWTDDDLRYCKDSQFWIKIGNESRPERGGHRLGIATDRLLGLTDENLSMIEQFILRWQ